ncbi:MAG: hypothetical protein HKN31_16170 [Pricia sp.]|nr:hypothetical protein [Pricia sp.]
MSVGLSEKLRTVVEHCYEAEKMLQNSKNATDLPEIEEYLQELSVYFKEFGDHLFLAISAEGGGIFPKIKGNDFDNPGEKMLSPPSEIQEKLRETIKKVEKILRELAHVLEYPKIPEDIALVLEKGTKTLYKKINKLKSHIDAYD